MVEVTRKCNMKCKHCMRGPAENMTMTKEIMTYFLADIKHINMIGFTGGEPTLPSGLKAIKQFIKICKAFKITVDSFFIITNGKVWRDDIPKVTNSLLKFCRKNNHSIIEISQDQFHDRIPKEREFFFQSMRTVFETELKETNFQVTKRAEDIDLIVDQGMATVNQIGTREYSSPTISPFGRNDVLRGIIYLNCVGKVIYGCDWSYASQNKPQNIICSVSDTFNKRTFNKFYADREG